MNTNSQDSIDRASPERAGEPGDQLRDPNWIAAYALGLASTERGEETCLRELVEAAEGASDCLDEARDRLQRLDAFDDGLRCRAERLLSSSLERLEVDE